MKKANPPLFSASFFQIGLVALVVFSCAILYENSLKFYAKEYESLKIHLNTLQEEYNQALALNTNLKRRVNSQSDPAWIEITLIKGLGLVPEGYQKVLFLKPMQPAVP